MHKASLELSRELYELSGWEGNDRWYMTDPGGKVIGTATPRIFKHDRDYENGYRTDTPAYDLGYLLRMLPPFTAVQKSDVDFNANFAHNDGKLEVFRADTPEDAACRLAIELFKQGILTKEGK